MSKLTLKVITPERVLFEGEVDKFLISGKGEVGEFEILPHHIPITSTVGNGKMKIFVNDNDIREATMFGGFVVVDDDNAVLMAEVAEWPDEIDVQRALAAKERAETRLKEENQDYVRARLALIRAINRIDLAEKYRN